MELRNKLLNYLLREYKDCSFDKERIEENESILKEIFPDKNSLIFFIYKNYNMTCFEYLEEDEDEFVFDSISLIADLENFTKYVHEKRFVPKTYIPISNGEAGYFTFYNKKNNKVYFCEIQEVDNIPQNSEKTWDSFEEYLIEYLGVQDEILPVTE